MTKNSDISSNKALSNARGKQIAMTRRITVSAILTAMAVVLMYLEVQLPFMPPFLKFDFSEIPVLVGAFALGPINAVIIELLKNLIHLPATGTMGIGEVSNFLTGSVFVLTAGFIYKKLLSRKGAVISMVIATVVLTAVACPLNYFVNIPLYGSVLGLPLEAIIGMSQAVNPYITSKITLILWAFLPFNIFKGIVVGFITFWIYKPVSKLIRKTRSQTSVPKKDNE